MSLRVGILGATGAVGQRLIQLLESHPTFDLVTLTASEESADNPYREVAKWGIEGPIPSAVATRRVVETTPDAVPTDVDLLFSSLPSGVARELEPAFCEAGYVVSSNSSNDRMAPDVPLVIPEVNATHLDLLEVQRDERGWDGALVKNPNCSTITFVPTLAAIADYGIERVHVATLQAVSGAGYDGVTSMEIIDNAVPFIGGEERKLETESRRLLGTFNGSTVDHHDVRVAASCNRIPTLDGHLENVWVETNDELTVDDAQAALEAYPAIDLDSAPEHPIVVFDEPDRPQPRLDRHLGDGMTITAGGLRESTFGLQYNCLSHNTIRGAAGASVLNGELLVDRGYL